MLCFTGDGGFYYHLAGTGDGTPLPHPGRDLVNNTLGFGQNLTGVHRIAGDRSDRGEALIRFGPTDFTAVARSFGVRGIRVEQPGEIAAALRQAQSPPPDRSWSMSSLLWSHAPLNPGRRRGRVDDRRIETFQTVWERPQNISRSGQVRDPFFWPLIIGHGTARDKQHTGTRGEGCLLAVTTGPFDSSQARCSENTPRREWRQSRCRHRSAFTRSTRANWIPSSSTSKRRPSRSMTRSVGRSWRPGSIGPQNEFILIRTYEDSADLEAKTKAFRKETEAAGITLGTNVAKMEVREVEMASDVGLNGCRTTRIYCRENCPPGRRTLRRNRVTFQSEAEAMASAIAPVRCASRTKAAVRGSRRQ